MQIKWLLLLSRAEYFPQCLISPTTAPDVSLSCSTILTAFLYLRTLTAPTILERQHSEDKGVYVIFLCIIGEELYKNVSLN